MKQNKRGWMLLSLLALFALFLLAREAVSWRPQLFARVDFNPTRLLFSRDGRRLLVVDDSGNSGDKAIFDANSGALNNSPQALARFNGDFYGEPSFPRVRWNRKRNQLYFSPVAGQNILLAQSTDRADNFVSLNQNQRVRAAWNPTRGEVYGTGAGEIFIWNWRDGQLKRRIRYGKVGIETATFSPDAKWLLAVQPLSGADCILGRYDVQTGQRVTQLVSARPISQLGFSPNDRYFWFLWSGTIPGAPGEIVMKKVSNWQSIYSGPCVGAPQWNRPGEFFCFTGDGFARVALERNRRWSIPGPKTLRDWTVSPDGQRIYSLDGQGKILKWRARSLLSERFGRRMEY